MIKVKARNKFDAANTINYKGYWVVETHRGLTLGASHITQEQAADLTLDQLSAVREALGCDWAIELIV